MEKSSYIIYNASAGSGKTFTLVKTFLKIILKTPNPDVFRSLLAITFTNKAVGEMKSRIIEKLSIFSDIEKAKKEPMFSQIRSELQLSEKTLSERASRVLKQILHNYSALSITTIDGFNHQLIRNFAFDLHLNPNFEVFLDVDDLIRQAVDNLLKKIGEDTQITELLIEFSKDKIRDNKNWDITTELLQVAKLLTIENNYEYLQSFQDKTLDDFDQLKKNTKQQLQFVKKSMIKNADNFFELADKQGWESEDFSHGSAYKFFKKIKENPNENIESSLETQWAIHIEDKPLYTKTLAKKNPQKASELDEYQNIIALYFRNIESDYHYKKYYQNILKNITPLAVLRSIQKEIETIKEEENILPISEFNNIIHQNISGQPTPFIYERIGQRYQHYFIDEFQDTSILQWHNILPLISDALQSENLSKVRGSLLLVGDAKQSIYRWRGGKAEQFMDLYLKEKNPFFIVPEIADLDKNFRSYEEIILFNNDFFKFISEEKRLFLTETYQNLYKSAIQNTHPKTQKGGYIAIEFLDIASTSKNEEEPITIDEAYSNSVLNFVKDAMNCGFEERNICILTRTNKQGIVLAQTLSDNGYKVISPDALLLANIAEIQFLILLSKLSLTENKELKANLLLLYCELKQIKDIHAFVIQYINEPISYFLDSVDFSMDYFHKYSYYEGISYAIERFGLAKNSDAYLSHFLNLVFEFKNIHKGGIYDFLQYWENKKETLSISAPSGLNAISVMTVHKSKGLEFPVIIYAYVIDDLTTKKDKIWLEVPKEDYFGFEYLLLDNYSGLDNVALQAVTLLSEQQLLDQLNIMYVAMTRPKAHLYIITDTRRIQKDSQQLKSFANVLREFLIYKNLYQEAIHFYEFGQKVTHHKQTTAETQYIEFVQSPSQLNNYTIVTKEGLLWDSKMQHAIEKGNLIHQLLAQIATEKDVAPILWQAQAQGIISKEQIVLLQEQILSIVHHTTISEYFSDKYLILNEQEFINHAGEYLRPDRVVIDTNTRKAILIDYKTGSFYPKYITQLREYASVLTKLNYQIKKAFLVFINEQIHVQEVNI